MSIVQRPHYTSEATAFLQSLKAQRPELESEQRQGRALLWDQTVDRQWNQAASHARVQQKPYVYQTEPLLR